MTKAITNLRNIGLAAHIDAGKTTVTERILFIAKKIHRMGEVHNGQAQMDWMAEEQERGISITAAATTFPWGNNLINLIDTPGHVDFTIEVERSLRVLDGVVIILCGVGGVEPQTETVWAQAQRYRVPRLAFVNKLDRAGADFSRVVCRMADQLTPPPLPIQIPIGEENNFVGVVDLVEERCFVWKDPANCEFSIQPVPDDLSKEVSQHRRELLEKVAEWDDDVLESVIEGQKVAVEALKKAIRRGTVAMKCVPVLCGAALRNKGIQPLLEAVVDYLPSPKEVPPINGINPDTGLPEERGPDPKEPLAALAFKVQVESEAVLTYLRIYSGVVKTGEAILNPRTGRKEKIAFLSQMHANKRKSVNQAGSGDIVAATGLKDVVTGDTLCSADHPILLEKIHLPDPVVSIVLEPRSLADRDRLLQMLEKVEAEDPTFRLSVDDSTGQIMASGMGELHLEVILHRLARDYRLQVRSGQPHVIYRETITGLGKKKARFDRELGGKRQVGEVLLLVQPGRRGSGVIFETGDLSPDIPPGLVEIAEQTIREVSTSGPLAGYQVDDVRCYLDQIFYQPGVTTEVGIRIATGQAFQEALKIGGLVLMEPIMEVVIVTPCDGVGEIISDLGQRGARIEEMADRPGNIKEIRAFVPLSVLFGYATQLRSLTKGKGVFSMEFSHYDLMSARER